MVEVFGFEVTVMETGPFTVSDADPVTELEVAVILVVPAASAVAEPEPLMLAIEPLEELQVTEEVRSFVLPSL
jgi:hypothetical protein